MTTFRIRTLYKVCMYLLPASLMVLLHPSHAADLSIALQLQVEEKQAAGTPVLMYLVVTNTGDAPLPYDCGGPGNYPSDWGFVAVITDGEGKSKRVPLDNGQYLVGSFRTDELQPGQSLTMPEVLAPLPVGSYTLQVSGRAGAYITSPLGISQKVQITVLDDAHLVQKFEQDVLQRNRQGEPIAAYLIKQYQLDAVVTALIPDLLSDDVNIALRAARTLDSLKRPLKEAAPFISRAVERELKKVWMVRTLVSDKGDFRHTSLMYYLASLASKIGSDEALSSVLALAHSQQDYQTRRRAVQFLGTFPQAQATQELRGFLQDQNDWVRSAAALALADRGDQAALPVLLELVANKNFQLRGSMFAGLLKFRNDPRVEPIVRGSLTDEDAGVRRMAAQVLKKLTTAPD